MQTFCIRLVWCSRAKRRGKVHAGKELRARALLLFSLVFSLGAELRWSAELVPPITEVCGSTSLRFLMQTGSRWSMFTPPLDCVDEWIVSGDTQPSEARSLLLHCNKIATRLSVRRLPDSLFTPFIGVGILHKVHCSSFVVAVPEPACTMVTDDSLGSRCVHAVK